MKLRLDREKLTETLLVGAVFNTILGGTSMAIIVALYQLPQDVKTSIFWAGALSLIFALAYVVQRLYKKDSFSLAIVGAGAGVGVLALIVSTPLALVLFPYLPAAASPFQGPVASTPGSDPVVVISTLAASICLLLAGYLHFKRK